MISGQGFPRSARLLLAEDFKRVFEKPARSADQYFTVLFRIKPLGSARLGLAIAKKNIKLANGRNRIKRLVRESFRLNQIDLPPTDIVVMAKPESARQPNQVLFASLSAHWKKLKAAC